MAGGMDWLNLTAIGTATFENAMNKLKNSGYISGIDTDGDQSGAEDRNFSKTPQTARNASSAQAAGSLRNAMLARGGISRRPPEAPMATQGPWSAPPLAEIQETVQPGWTIAGESAVPRQLGQSPSAAALTLTSVAESDEEDTVSSPVQAAVAVEDDASPEKVSSVSDLSPGAEVAEAAEPPPLPECSFDIDSENDLAAAKPDVSEPADLAAEPPRLPSDSDDDLATASPDARDAPPAAEDDDRGAAAVEGAGLPFAAEAPLPETGYLSPLGASPTRVESAPACLVETAAELAEIVPAAHVDRLEETAAESAPAAHVDRQETAAEGAPAAHVDRQPAPRPPQPSSSEAAELNARLEARRRKADAEESQRASEPRTSSKEELELGPKAVSSTAWSRKPAEDAEQVTESPTNASGPPKAQRRMSWIRDKPEAEVEELPERKTAGKLGDMKAFWNKNSKGFAGPALGQGSKISKTEAQATLQRLISAGSKVDYDEVRRLRKLVDHGIEKSDS